MTDKYKLCLIKNEIAYFTTQDIKDQWGDDWNDAPYECNAGRPYASNDGKWKILEVVFYSDLETPDVKGDSHVSVQEINKGKVPWLRSMDYPQPYKISIYAGCTVENFIAIIKASGGRIFLEMLK